MSYNDRFTNRRNGVNDVSVSRETNQFLEKIAHMDRMLIHAESQTERLLSRIDSLDYKVTSTNFKVVGIQNEMKEISDSIKVLNKRIDDFLSQEEEVDEADEDDEDEVNFEDIDFDEIYNEIQMKKEIDELFKDDEKENEDDDDNDDDETTDKKNLKSRGKSKCNQKKK